ARNTTGHRTHVTKHRVACTSCHELTGTTIEGAPPTRCRTCHAKEATIVHAPEAARQRFGPKAQADCTVCHAFGSKKAEGVADAAVARPGAHSAGSEE